MLGHGAARGKRRTTNGGELMARGRSGAGLGSSSRGRDRALPKQSPASGRGADRQSRAGTAGNPRSAPSRSAAGARAAKASPGRATGSTRRLAFPLGEVLEGVNPVREALLAGRRRVREIWLAADLEAATIDDLTELARSRRAVVRLVSRREIEAKASSSSPQGVVAVADPLPLMDPTEMLKAGGAAPPLLVALDGVTDPHNVGAVIRTASCFGAAGVILPRHGSARITPVVAKAAAGGIEWTPIGVVAGLPNCLADLARAGVWIVGLAADGEADVFDLDLATSAVCLVVGAEGAGLSRLVRARCDVVAKIPMSGRLDSLNVSVATGIAAAAISRARR